MIGLIAVVGSVLVVTIKMYVNELVPLHSIDWEKKNFLHTFGLMRCEKWFIYPYKQTILAGRAFKQV